MCYHISFTVLPLHPHQLNHVFHQHTSTSTHSHLYHPNSNKGFQLVVIHFHSSSNNVKINSTSGDEDQEPETANMACLLDYGASNPMINAPVNLPQCTYNCGQGKRYVVNGFAISISHIGLSYFQKYNNRYLILNNVLIAPQISKNIALCISTC